MNTIVDVLGIEVPSFKTKAKLYFDTMDNHEVGIDLGALMVAELEIIFNINEIKLMALLHLSAERERTLKAMVLARKDELVQDLQADLKRELGEIGFNLTVDDNNKIVMIGNKEVKPDEAKGRATKDPEGSDK